MTAGTGRADMAPDLRVSLSAPGRTRTCDPLLRRPERYSKMLLQECADSKYLAIFRDATKQFL